MTCRNSASWRRLSGLAAVLSLAVFAGACSSDGEKEAKRPTCPHVGVLADAAQFVQFASSNTDLNALVFRAEMVNAAGSCEYEDDYVEMALAIQVHAVRPSTGEAGTFPTRYFVAVVDADERILAKEYFSLPITFEASARQSVVRSSLENFRIPVKRKKRGDGYQVIVGFELTRDQVIYNRVTSGKSRNGK